MSRRQLWHVLRALLAALLVFGADGVRGESIQAEKELGKKFAFEAAAQLPLLRDPDVVAYVDHIGQRIVAALGSQPFQYSFFVVRDPQINAFAVPGGYIYVHSGLLSAVGNDDELAGVLGHEVAHVNAHHLAREQEATKLMSYATLLAMFASVIHPAIGATALGASAAAQLKYRREFEQEADYLGAGYMKKAGFAPRGMLDFFNELWEEQRTTPTFVPPYLLSHPLTEERLNHLEAVLREKQWDKKVRPATSDELALVQLIARLRTDDVPAVLTSYRKAVAEHPKDARARFLLGTALLETGSYDAAKVALEQGRDLGYKPVDRELGRTLFRLGQLEPARVLLARATETRPADAVAQFEYGRVLEALGSTDMAATAYRRAIEAAPYMSEAHYQLGMLAGRGGKQGDGFYHLAMADMLRGDYPEALSRFEKAVPLLGESDPALTRAKANVKLLQESAHRRTIGP